MDDPKFPVFQVGEDIILWNYKDNCPNKVKVIESLEDELTIEYWDEEIKRQDTAHIGNLEALLKGMDMCKDYGTPLWQVMSEDGEENEEV